jgi:hypothetical protein
MNAHMTTHHDIRYKKLPGPGVFGSNSEFRCFELLNARPPHVRDAMNKN